MVFSRELERRAALLSGWAILDRLHFLRGLGQPPLARDQYRYSLTAWLRVLENFAKAIGLSSRLGPSRENTSVSA